MEGTNRLIIFNGKFGYDSQQQRLKLIYEKTEENPRLQLYNGKQKNPEKDKNRGLVDKPIRTYIQSKNLNGMQTEDPIYLQQQLSALGRELIQNKPSLEEVLPNLDKTLAKYNWHPQEQK